MAKQNRYPLQSLPPIPPEKAIELLSRQIEASSKLLSNGRLPETALDGWQTTTRQFITKIFGGGDILDDFDEVGRLFASPMNAGDAWWENHRRECLEGKTAKLVAYIDVLKADIELQQPPTPKTAAKSAPAPQTSRKVFVVHGHDEVIRENCARFLEKLDLHPIILHEKPNAGRTIIEKFHDYSDVCFAVVLLTADDKGGTKDSEVSQLNARARQNVILELGFFVGKLGRANVCTIYEAGVELPSDYHGVVFIELDPKAAWQLHLARELRHAGIDIDLNRAF